MFETYINYFSNSGGSCSSNDHDSIDEDNNYTDNGTSNNINNKIIITMTVIKCNENWF